MRGPVTPRLPASFLQLHRSAEVWLTSGGAAQRGIVGRSGLDTRVIAVVTVEQFLEPRFDVLADRVADEVVRRGAAATAPAGRSGRSSASRSRP